MDHVLIGFLQLGFYFEGGHVLPWGSDEAATAAFLAPTRVDHCPHYREYLWSRPCAGGVAGNARARFWEHDQGGPGLRSVFCTLDEQGGPDGYKQLDHGRFVPELERLFGPASYDEASNHLWVAGDVRITLYETDPGEFSSAPFRLYLSFDVA